MFDESVFAVRVGVGVLLVFLSQLALQVDVFLRRKHTKIEKCGVTLIFHSALRIGKTRSLPLAVPTRAFRIPEDPAHRGRLFVVEKAR